MIIYEIKCYINEQTDNKELYAYVKELLKRNEDVSIYKSWENGYHIALFGTFLYEDVEKVAEQLSIMIKESPTMEYNEDEFKQRYLPVANLLHKMDALEPILQNKVMVYTTTKGYKEFQNDEQYELYVFVNGVFDCAYMDYYWKQDLGIIEIIRDLVPFISFLPESIISEEDDIYSNGYVSHLSHYLGFLHSLRESDQIKINERFQQRASKENNLLTNTRRGRDDLLHGLIQSYERIGKLVDEEKLNFYSPNDEEEFLLHTNEASSRHKAVFEKPEIREVVVKDKVLCTNRWVLNVLYEKLILLGISPIEKFYMNYVISKAKYTDSLLEVK